MADPEDKKKSSQASREAAQKYAADLLKKADELAGSAKDNVKKAKDGVKSVKNTAEMIRETYDQASMIGRTFSRIAVGFSWVNRKIIDPVMSLLPVVRPLWKAALRQYDWFCNPREPFKDAVGRGYNNFYNHKKNAVANLFRKEKAEFQPSVAEGMPTFSKTRAGIATLTTAFLLAAPAEQTPIAPFVPDWISEASHAFPYETLYDAGVMTATALFNKGSLHHEVIYTNGATEIDPKHDLWNVKACEKTAYCGSEETLYFRIKPSIMHQAWSLSTGHGWFLPDYAAAAVPNVPSKCDVTTYGMRGRISKRLNVYPNMLDVKCEALPGAPAPAK
ncbi:MAG: hypothetical protein JWO78_520 [Micavibrio sp.]|nr:hypothetical protein [Micavibrio sp.]